MSRKVARERAFEFLFGLEINDTDVTIQQEMFLELNPIVNEDDREFFCALVAGVQEHDTELAEMIIPHLRRWTYPRLPKVDRTILRLAAYELKLGEVPAAVAINEAVVLAKKYAEDNAYQYINGLLRSVAKTKEQVD